MTSTHAQPSIRDPAAVLIRLARKSFTGTVRLSPPEGSAGQVYYFHFTAGQLDDAIPEMPPSILERTIREPGLLSERDLRKLEKRARQEGWTLAEFALTQGLFTAEEISTAIVHKLARILGDALAERWSAAEEPNPPQSHLVEGLAKYFQLSVPIPGLLLDSARTRAAWKAIRTELPELKDVLGAAPGAAGYVSRREEFPLHAALIEAADGARDLAQVIEECDQDPFDAYDCVQQLIEEGALQPLNPVQLFQLGCDLERGGNHAKALRLFERAEERGLDDFDLGYRLGELYQRTGRTPEAVERFLAFAEKCVAQYRIEDTIRACKRIIELDPGNIQVLERYVSLLARYGKREEALRDGLALSRQFAERGEHARALSTLEKIIDLAEANEEVLRFYLDLCNSTGHQPGAVKAQRRLANLFHQREDMTKAIEFYQGLFVNGEDGPDVRCRLIDLHFASGQRARALEHLVSLQNLPKWSARNAEKEAQEFFRRLLSRGVREPEITAWLSDEAGVRGNRQELLRYLDLHCQLLEEAGRLDEARRTAQQIVRLDPRNTSAARRFSTLELRRGCTERAAQVLEELAQRLDQDAGNAEELREVLEELVVINPLSVAGRKMLLPHAQRKGPSARHSKQALEMILLKLVAGEYGRAEAMLDDFPEGTTLRGSFYLIAGLLSRWQGDAEKSQIWFSKGARLAHESSDRSALALMIDQLRAIDPKHPEIEGLSEALQAMPTAAENQFTRAPEKLQGKVTGITARLRSMKGQGSDAPGDAGAAPTTEIRKPAAALKCVGALRNLRVSAPPAAEEFSPAPEHASDAAVGVAQAHDATTVPPVESVSPDAAPAAPAPRPLPSRGVDALKKLRGQHSAVAQPDAESTAPSAAPPVAAAKANPDALPPPAPPIPTKIKGIGSLKKLRETQGNL